MISRFLLFKPPNVQLVPKQNCPISFHFISTTGINISSLGLNVRSHRDEVTHGARRIHTGRVAM